VRLVSRMKATRWLNDNLKPLYFGLLGLRWLPVPATRPVPPLPNFRIIFKFPPASKLVYAGFPWSAMSACVFQYTVNHAPQAVDGKACL